MARACAHRRDYNYYTDPIVEPYLSRRRQCGWGLYGTLGIGRGDHEKSKAYRAGNFNFFGAPVGLVFTIDRELEKGSWLDYGMFLQTIMLAARAKGLHTCAEAAIANYPDIVRRELNITRDWIVICGMAMGYADPDAVVNTFQPPRIALEEYALFLDEENATAPCDALAFQVKAARLICRCRRCRGTSLRETPRSRTWSPRGRSRTP